MTKPSPHPIENIQWVEAEKLTANGWNPNRVFTQEMKLLERNILGLGWAQPVLVSRDMMIIDGFHRTTLALASKAIRKKWGSKVPCAVLDVNKGQAMILTIRMNRAKGTHAAAAMSLIVRELIDELHYDPQEVAIEIGATADEVELLRQDGVFKKKGIADRDPPYSSAWYPKETRNA